MKNKVTLIICIISAILLYLICYGYSENYYPNEYYNVYLDGKLLGVIESEDELKNYINEKTEYVINVLEETNDYCDITEEVKKAIETASSVEYYKKDDKECAKVTTKVGTPVDEVYLPEGLKIEKIYTYSNNVDEVSKIYDEIVSIKSFTVRGYQFSIKEEESTKYINVIDKSIFETSVNDLIKTYVGEEKYTAYLNNTQEKIETTGTIIENVYIAEDISVVEKNIPITEKIYTDSKELSSYLLFGDDSESKQYTVKEEEMIDEIALNNEISVQEFLITNPKYKNASSLISPGTNVNIKVTSPQLRVVVESYVVEDMVNEYKTVYQYDDSQFVGYSKTIQTGQDGLERVKQTVQVINGITVYVEPKGKEVLKPSADEIIIKGDKYVPNIGDTSNWSWPSESGWTISDPYAWRTHPITGVRQFHQAIDIAGTGYGSKVYAANNGTVIRRQYDSSYGNYIAINHNNGYYTLYAHMSKFAEGITVGSTVSRGQVIGYVGSTGSSTGPHIHFEVWKNCEFCRISPWTLYK